MKHPLNLYAIVALAILSIVSAKAQTDTATVKHFEKAGTAFDYPEGWQVTDRDSQGMQTVTLTRQGSVAKIVLNMQDHSTSINGIPPVRRGVTTIIGEDSSAKDIPLAGGGGTTDKDPCGFEVERNMIADAAIEKVAAQIHAHVASGVQVTSQISGTEIQGLRLQGIVKGSRVTAEVFSARLDRRFVSLILIFAADDIQAPPAWDAVRNTLKVEPGPSTVLGTSPAPATNSNAPITGGVLNGSALALPPPEYPSIARSAHASGTIKVQVIIDETGNVLSAHAVSGHPLLQAVSVAAAKQARFSPTHLCGEPVKVTGIITYNFVSN